MIITVGQTAFTVIFTSRVTRQKKMCLPDERELPSALHCYGPSGLHGGDLPRYDHCELLVEP